MNIVIAGYGVVGEALHTSLTTGVYENQSNFNIKIDDPLKGYVLNIPDTVDAVIVCVSTPMAEDGSCDISNVQDVFTKYSGSKFLVKSTTDIVWLSHATKVNDGSFTFSPEFLCGTTGAAPIQDFMNQKFAIYGGDDCEFWHELLKPNLRQLETVRFVTLEQAVFGKYLENCFLATKVGFFNEMFELYEALGLKGFHTMVEAITLDERIGTSHTQVPGPDGRKGYGGHCFPKDTSALQHTANTNGIELKILSAVIESNEHFRSTECQTK